MKKQNQTILTAFFMAVMLAGFGGVAFVSNYYQINAETVNLWQTDTNTDFAIYEHINAPEKYFDSYRSCQRHNYGDERIQYNRTPAYLGNLTYSIGFNDSNFASHEARYLINMNEMGKWIIQYIVINMTKNTDTDIRLTVFSEHFNGNTYDVSLPLGKQKRYNQINLDWDVGLTSGTEFNKNISIPLTTALSIRQDCIEFDNSILGLVYLDSNFDGIETFAWNLKITIYGTVSTTWGLIDSMTTVLIISTIGNIIIGVYMTDGIDVGGYIKDLRKHQRRR